MAEAGDSQDDPIECDPISDDEVLRASDTLDAIDVMYGWWHCRDCDGVQMWSACCYCCDWRNGGSTMCDKCSSDPALYDTEPDSDCE